MGRKKKFIDKKKSATFQLMARDSSDPNYSPGPDGDRVFVRVDNNQYTPDSFNEGDPDSIFADAAEGCDDEGVNDGVGGVYDHRAGLPDHIRKEILELGFPDDGYNYLEHMREIRNTGGGSAYYDNPKANFELLPRDVKAYDASRIDISNIKDAPEEKAMYNVASKTVGVRLQKAVDPEVAAMLDDSDSSKFGSDIEDLEEDFIVKANLLEGIADEEINEKSSSAAGSSDHLQKQGPSISGAPLNGAYVSGTNSEDLRVRRPLDEQFDLLELNEYASDNEEEYNGYMDDDECQESLTEKLNHAFKAHPSGLLRLNKELEDSELPEVTAEVISRCREYAEKYEDGNHDEVEEVLFQESSDESEVWDCETIVSTYSTLDNHPGKIGAPESRRRKKLLEAISETSAGPHQVITLKGKERLPVDFLPRSKKHGDEKPTDGNIKKVEVEKKKPRGQETKEEKKERKSAVKLERREAREMKKGMKELYKSEATRAQKVAAFTGPSSIHLM